MCLVILGGSLRLCVSARKSLRTLNQGDKRLGHDTNQLAVHFISPYFRAMKLYLRGLALLWCTMMLSQAIAQTLASERLRALDNTDSLYIAGFQRNNDVRVHYTLQRYLLEYGSQTNPGSGTARFTNVTELLGAGFTYKWLDLDLSFSLPQTRILETGIQNLTQFRLSGSFSTRRWSVRGYLIQSTGMVAADADGQFISGPSVDLLNLGIHYTYIFNHRRFSFREAAYQTEIQLRPAGSFLLRIEPFYRHLGVGSSMVPPALDTPARYGEQAGLEYVYAPGITVQPGFGYNWSTANGKWFASPMIFVGGGLAVNVYKASSGERTSVNPELKGSATLNFGYNGDRWYASIRSSWEHGYFQLDPAFFRTSDLKLGITVGYRFNYFEKFLPESLF